MTRPPERSTWPSSTPIILRTRWHSTWTRCASLCGVVVARSRILSHEPGNLSCRWDVSSWPIAGSPTHRSRQALGWVRVRAGREDCFAFAVKQVRADKFMVCFSNVATFLTSKGDLAAHPEGQPDKIVFETAPATCVWTPEAVIAFSENRMERRSIQTGKITHQVRPLSRVFCWVASRILCHLHHTACIMNWLWGSVVLL